MLKLEGHGHLHPITQTTNDIVRIFSQIGFSVLSGPELETEYYNFDALNVPPNHPARDMQDTFWLKKPMKDGGSVLRTHTTSVLARYLKNGQLPVRAIAPGKVFRNEATDATHEAQFFQVDGFAVGEGVSMATLKDTLTYFFKQYFGDDVLMRFRPSFFSFTEPSVEVDVKFNGKWLEMLGAGMINPKVFEAAGLDPKKHQGFAFGGGVDRFVMVKYGIDDVRTLYSGDLRLVNQF